LTDAVGADERRAGGQARAERAALRVAVGIFCSRVAGLVRQRVFAHYFGLTGPADAFTAASRIPNVLNNLFGEGALSGSFIPVYASLLARGERELADRVAGAIAALLALIVAVVVVAGIAVTPWVLPLIAPGFTGPTRDLAITLVRILFPAVGLTVMSAWCLGVLNSHRRFFLSYAVSVIWNGAMIATLLLFGEGSELPLLAERLAWGSVVGSALMVAAQLPVVLRVAPNLSFALETGSEQVRTIARNFVPVFMSRGVVQLSGYIDTLLATLVSTGATTALANAQTLFLLPVSLFGMSVSAAELPAMAGLADGDEDGTERLRHRIDDGLRQIAFFIVPSAAAFLALGDVIAAALFQTGRFGHDDAVYVWGILAGSAVGLLASTLGRLYASAYYALRDTRRPLNFAIVRVVLTTVLGYVFAIPLPRWLGVAPAWGAAGLTASAGIAGWVEMLLLRQSLNARIGRTGLPAGYLGTLWASALAAAAAAWAVKLTFFPPHPILAALLILGLYGIVFLSATIALGVPEAKSALGLLSRGARRRQ
jgi:putative peptidoglycan lipid II flippase